MRMPTAGRARAISCRSRTGRDRQQLALGHDHDPRSVLAGEHRLRRRREAARGQAARAAHLLDRRDRLWRQGGRGSMRASTATTTRSSTSAGSRRRAARSIKNYNQPRRDQRQMVVARRRRRGHAGRGRGRLAVRHGHDHRRRRQLHARAQHPARVFLRGHAAVLRRLADQLHADAGGHLWRARGRSLLAAGDRRLRRSAAGPHPAARAAGATTARRVKAPDWAFVDDDSAREAQEARRRAARWSRSARTASRPASRRIGSCGVSCAAA